MTEPVLQHSDTPSLRVFSIGHSNHAIEKFLGLLQDHGIQVLVDTRSQPYSKYSPQYEKRAIMRAAESAGIRYVFLGAQLGGRPSGDEFYDSEGHVLYGKVADSGLFLEGILRLEPMLQSKVALMCSEEDPAVCHRKLLVGRVLKQRGIEMLHIRGDGTIQKDEELEDDSEQLALFDAPEEKPWRSLRSVLPADQRPTSSTP